MMLLHIVQLLHLVSSLDLKAASRAAFFVRPVSALPVSMTPAAHPVPWRNGASAGRERFDAVGKNGSAVLGKPAIFFR